MELLQNIYFVLILIMNLIFIVGIISPQKALFWVDNVLMRTRYLAIGWYMALIFALGISASIAREFNTVSGMLCSISILILFVCFVFLYARQKNVDVIDKEKILEYTDEYYEQHASAGKDAVCLVVLKDAESAMHAINLLPQVRNGTTSPATIIKEHLHRAVTVAVQDNVLSEKDERNIAELFRINNMDINALPDETKKQLRKALLCKYLLNGVVKVMVPQNGYPVTLQKKEIVIWYWTDINISVMKTQRTYHGGSSGISVRIAKGIYYRTGGSRGHAVYENVLQNMGKGYAIVTNRYLYYCADNMTKRIALKNIIAVNAYKNSVQIDIDGSRGKPIVLESDDPQFMAICIVNASNWN